MAYYVTARHHDRTAFLVGPFNRHGDALRVRFAATNAASDVDSDAHWYAYGTSRVKFGPLPAGRLNERLGFPTDGTRLSLPPLPRTSVNRRVFLHGTGPAPRGYVRCLCADESHYHPIERS